MRWRVRDPVIQVHQAEAQIHTIVEEQAAFDYKMEWERTLARRTLERLRWKYDYSKGTRFMQALGNRLREVLGFNA